MVCFVVNFERFFSCYEMEIGCYLEDLVDFIYLLECFNWKYLVVLLFLIFVFKIVYELKILIFILFYFLSVVFVLY